MDKYHTCAECGDEKFETSMYYCEKCKKHYCKRCKTTFPASDSYGEYEKVWIHCPEGHTQGSEWRKSAD